jgi:Tol biopolymer transport system component
MSLEAGAQLGPYTLIAPLGAGGMGEVYRARDTALKRDVAIKVLPDVLTSDPDRLARFEREAQTLAALNHPNIAQIHGLERSGDTPAIVMELVEGPTLADRIRTGPIPLDEVLPIARQLTEALEAAHERGIIHRDLKPANIKVREDGTVKVLDFGLAKAMAPVPASPEGAELANSPTMTARATQMGIVLGTAAYMAPEQAKGKHVDKRADIWAVGVVLFELLTGRRPFDGDDVTEVMARVVDREPDWRVLPADIPPSIRRLLRRCLTKKRHNRLADIIDARLEIDEVATDAAAAPPERSHDDPRRARWALPALVSAVATALLAALAVLSLWPERQSADVTRFTIPLPEGQILGPASDVLAVSHDGRQFVYATTDGLYRRILSDLQSTPIPGTEGRLTSPVFSPEGDEIAYFQDGQLKGVTVTGGTPRVICAADPPRGVSWERDGTTDGTILFGQADGIYQVSASGGDTDLVLEARPGEDVYGPQLLPDGEHVLFTSARTALTSQTPPERWNEAQVEVVSRRTNVRTRLQVTGNSPRYLSTGHLAYSQANELRVVSFDADELQVGTDTVTVAPDVGRARASAASAYYEVSDSGALLYVQGHNAPVPRGLAWVSRDGQVDDLGIEHGQYWYPRLSPDGSRVVLDDRNDTSDLWVWDFTTARRRLTVEGTPGTYPAWTPNSDRIAYSSGADRHGDAGHIDWRSADGGGADLLVPLQAGGGTLRPYFFFEGSAGLELVFGALNPESQDIGMVALNDGEIRWLLNESFNESNAELSPDGRWMAYQSNHSDRSEISIRSFPDMRQVVPVSTDGGTKPRWSWDGQFLYYLSGRTMIEAAVDPDGAVLSVVTRTPLPEVRVSPTGAGRSYDVDEDGRFLTPTLVDPSAGETEAQVTNLVIVLNWFETLKREVR